ncbi:MAG: hypothetical protein MR518_03615, partial [Mollicutes bacterium]|nr:hypothetical protein [Mollicutes bacterium]
TINELLIELIIELIVLEKDKQKYFKMLNLKSSLLVPSKISQYQANDCPAMIVITSPILSVVFNTQNISPIL